VPARRIKMPFRASGVRERNPEASGTAISKKSFPETLANRARDMVRRSRWRRRGREIRGPEMFNGIIIAGGRRYPLAGKAVAPRPRDESAAVEL